MYKIFSVNQMNLFIVTQDVADLVKDGGERPLKFFRCSKQQDESRLLDEGQNTDEDQSGDEQRTDGVGDVPAERLDQQRGHDHSNTAEGVGENM